MSSYLTRKEKKQLPKMVDIDPYRAEQSGDNAISGGVEIDNDLCNGCKLCVEICPAATLEMTGKTSVAMIGENPLCISCGDCIPICLPDAIKMAKYQEYKGLYKFIGRGEPSKPRKF